MSFILIQTTMPRKVEYNQVNKVNRYNKKKNRMFDWYHLLYLTTYDLMKFVIITLGMIKVRLSCCFNIVGFERFIYHTSFFILLVFYSIHLMNTYFNLSDMIIVNIILIATLQNLCLWIIVTKEIHIVMATLHTNLMFKEAVLLFITMVFALISFKQCN